MSFSFLKIGHFLILVKDHMIEGATKRFNASQTIHIVMEIGLSM